MYVHIASQGRFYDDGFALVVLAGASLGLTTTIQELTKMRVVWRDIQQIWSMCTLVGSSTVLINTQVQVMLLLRKQSARYHVLRSVAMAVVEFAMRIGKMALILCQIQRRKSAIERAAPDVSSRSSSEHSSHQMSFSWEERDFSGETRALEEADGELPRRKGRGQHLH